MSSFLQFVCNKKPQKSLIDFLIKYATSLQSLISISPLESFNQLNLFNAHNIFNFLPSKEFIANQSRLPLLKTPRISQKWKNYSMSYVHVNVDASFMKIETITSIAGVIRNHWVDWIRGFQGLSYATNSLHAECLAIRQGLHIASKAKFSHIVIHSYYIAKSRRPY